MTSWDIEITRTLVEQIYGVSQLALISPCLESLAERQTYASYHFYEYKEILNRHIDSKLEEKHILELTLLHTADQWRIDNALTQAAANVMACLQSMHALLDTLAHVVCFGAGLNIGPDAITEKNIASNTVRQALKRKSALEDVLKHFNEIENSKIIKQLCALVNHSKHRSVIRPVLNVDLRNQNAQPYGLEFPAFNHKGISYPSAKVDTFLQNAYGTLSPAIVACGNALNAALVKTAS